jgi:hypothetical protein
VKWIRSAVKLLSFDVSSREREKPRTIEIVELDELYSSFYDLKKNEGNRLNYGLLLIGEEMKLLRLR